MKNILLFFIGLIIIMIEIFFLNFLNGFINVNFLLIYVVFISLYIDKSESLVLSGLLGLMLDIISGGIIGVTSILFLVTSYFITSVEKIIFKEKKYIVALLVLLISFVYSIINCVVGVIFYTPQPLVIILVKIFLESVINSIAAYVLYLIFEERLVKLKKD